MDLTLHRIASAPSSAPLAEQFNPRANSLGFLRWLFAAMVVVDHSFPIGGLGKGSDPTWTWTHGQESLGGISLAGFFVISGFLVSRSWHNSRSPVRFLWRRFLRIFPGFWVCLVITAVVFAPIAWHYEYGGFMGVFHVRSESPETYVTGNLWLTMHQYNIGGLFQQTPFARSGNPLAWDGSLWTLIYEFRCYLVLGVLGFFGVLARRKLVVLSCAGLYLITISWLIDPVWAGRLVPVFSDLFVARFGFLFALGTVFALYADRIVIDDRLGIGAALLSVWTLHSGGWLALGYPAFAYVVFWLAVRLPIRNWERFGDLSYGTYIWAFPLQMLLAQRGLQRFGTAAFIAASLACATGAAVISWHVVEKNALRLKNWTPRNPHIGSFFGRRRVPHPVADSRDVPTDVVVGSSALTR